MVRNHGDLALVERQLRHAGRVLVLVPPHPVHWRRAVKLRSALYRWGYAMGADVIRADLAQFGVRAGRTHHAYAVRLDHPGAAGGGGVREPRRPRPGGDGPEVLRLSLPDIGLGGEGARGL